MLRLFILIAHLTFLTACSSSPIEAPKDVENSLMEIDVPVILESSFEELRSLYGDPVEEDYLKEVVDGELFETTPYYRWNLNGYRLEVYYDVNGQPFVVRLITEPLLEKDTVEFFDEINVSKPYIPSDRPDEGSYRWVDQSGWTFVASNFSGNSVELGVTTLVVDRDEY